MSRHIIVLFFLLVCALLSGQEEDTPKLKPLIRDKIQPNLTNDSLGFKKGSKDIMPSKDASIDQYKIIDINNQTEVLDTSLTIRKEYNC